MKKMIDYGRYIVVDKPEVEAWLTLIDEELSDDGCSYGTLDGSSVYRVSFKLHGVKIRMDLRTLLVDHTGMYYGQGEEYNLIRFDTHIYTNIHSAGLGSRGQDHYDRINEVFSYLFDVERGGSITG